jgi:hypothetical protein
MVIAVSTKCPDCGNLVEPGAQFCPKCFARIEPPTFWQKLLRFFQSSGGPRRSMVTSKKTVSINTIDKDGQRHEYHSLEDVPPELREQIEKLQSEALKEGPSSTSSDGLTTTFVTTKKASLFKIKDAAGNERIYHPLEELPPEIRAAIDQAQNRIKD